MDNSITIGNIILWERLAERSFSTFDIGSTTDMAMLMYVIDNPRCGFSTYAKSLEITKDKQLRDKVRAIGKSIERFLQYRTKSASDEDSGTPAMVGDVVGGIIYTGQSAADILSLSIDYLPYLVEQYCEHLKRSRERDRDMMYTLLSPYLEKGTTPYSFMPLPWDDESAASAVSDEDIEVANFLFNHSKPN